MSFFVNNIDFSAGQTAALSSPQEQLVFNK